MYRVPGILRASSRVNEADRPLAIAERDSKAVRSNLLDLAPLTEVPAATTNRGNRHVRTSEVTDMTAEPETLAGSPLPASVEPSR